MCDTTPPQRRHNAVSMDLQVSSLLALPWLLTLEGFSTPKLNDQYRHSIVAFPLLSLWLFQEIQQD